jgi:UDP-N-acetylglucosamine pyrophosphorylase
MSSIEQLKMPTIDESGELTTKRQAPCGHGFIGFHEIIDAVNSSTNEIVCIGNGEDINSTIDSKIASLVVSQNIPILMITTDKTSVDLKGGQLALVKENVPYLTIVEKAQAQKSNQLEYFEKLGLRANDKKALFNTNVAVINKKALRKVISKYVENFDLDTFLDKISPNVIKNTKTQDNEQFIQLESALGSVLLNTDKFFREEFGVKVLSILNLSTDDREKFFLPIKSRPEYDFIKSNYIFDEADLKLKKS